MAVLKFENKSLPKMVALELYQKSPRFLNLIFKKVLNFTTSSAKYRNTLFTVKARMQ
jgi:hypothetical protein